MGGKRNRPPNSSDSTLVWRQVELDVLRKARQIRHHQHTLVLIAANEGEDFPVVGLEEL